MSMNDWQVGKTKVYMKVGPLPPPLSLLHRLPLPHHCPPPPHCRRVVGHLPLQPPINLPNSPPIGPNPM